MKEAAIQLELLGDDLVTSTNFQEAKETYIKVLTAKKYVTGGDGNQESTDQLLHKLSTLCEKLLCSEEALSYFPQIAPAQEKSKECAEGIIPSTQAF